MSQQLQLRGIPSCIVCGKDGLNLYQGLKDYTFSVEGEWDLLKCPYCNHIWQKCIPEEEDIGRLYSTYYTHSNLKETTLRKLLKRGIPAMRFGFRTEALSLAHRYAAFLLSLFGPLLEFAQSVTMGLEGRKTGSILDVGCGAGEFLKLMEQFGWKTTGTEIDPVAAQTAVENLESPTIIQGQLKHAELKPESYDVVTMSHVLEHLDSPREDLLLCHSLLKDGGILSISTPNSQSLGTRIFESDWRGYEVPRHFHIYNPSGLTRVLEDCGFSIEKVMTPTCIASFIWSASSKIRASRRGLKSSSLKKLMNLCVSVLFWFYEYYKNKKSPCGEEILILAKKVGKRGE